MQVVDQPGFDAIECNQCGQCCKSLSLPGPSEIRDRFLTKKSHTDSFKPQDQDIFWGQLIPLKPVADSKSGQWTYRCSYYDDDKGCTIYEDRPKMCREFPYDKPIPEHSECSWNVDIFDFEVWTDEVPV